MTTTYEASRAPAARPAQPPAQPQAPAQVQAPAQPQAPTQAQSPAPAQAPAQSQALAPERYLAPPATVRIGSWLTLSLAWCGLLPLAALWWCDTTSMSSAAEMITAIGRLAGLGAAYAMLLVVIVAARIPALEQGTGTDKLLSWHASLGRYAVCLTSVHLVAISWGCALSDHSGLLTEAWSLLTGGWALICAGISCLLLLVIGAVSAHLVRARVSYEAWHAVHLATYAAIVLAVFHQIAAGQQFASHPVAAWTWGLSWCAALVALAAFRVIAPLRLNLRHRFTVAAVTPETPGVTSVYLTGRDLGSLRAAAGQFFRFRFLAPGLRLAANPYSLSATPRTSVLRITVKAAGTHSAALARLTPGTRVLASGPYGAMTLAARKKPGPTVLLAGGIGVAPLRALLEALGPHASGASLIYRSHSPADAVFTGELAQLASLSGAQVFHLTGPREQEGNQITAQALVLLAPAIAMADVYVCGPKDFTDAAIAAARAAHVPARRIHAGQFAW